MKIKEIRSIETIEVDSANPNSRIVNGTIINPRNVTLYDVTFENGITVQVRNPTILAVKAKLLLEASNVKKTFGEISEGDDIV